ncbi:MAG: hypothetical protein QM765_26995 [Myxococcales bacterium]
MGLYQQLLLFPDRAEFLKQFDQYRVRLDHWKNLSAVFSSAFKQVHERHGAAILLVHGAQGTGKTLFGLQLEKGFEQARKGEVEPAEDNLWHVLVGEKSRGSEVIRQATDHASLRMVKPEAGWLETERQFAKVDRQGVRIFVVDDVHKDVFLSAWAGLSQADYLRLKADKKESVAISTVAQQLVQDCRGDFQRSLFLLLSNKPDMMRELKRELDESHRGLATLIELPLPQPELKEEIVRTNTNRLNPVSYWYCLDHAGPDEKRSVYSVLSGEGGFTDCFNAIDSARRSEADSKRAGRPANKNLITLVTIGSSPLSAKAFLEDQELMEGAKEHYVGPHHATWMLRESWASRLNTADDPNLTRRARMLESEFALRWVALGARASWALLESQPSPGDLGERLLDVVRFFPSVAKPGDIKKEQASSRRIDEEIGAMPLQEEELVAFSQRMLSLGQRRSKEYEEKLAKRLNGYGKGFSIYPSVKPDFIVEEYSPCAVTKADSDSTKAIEDAIRRTCHVIEFTAHLQEGMRGLAEYLLAKVERYSELLESV